MQDLSKMSVEDLCMKVAQDSYWMRGGTTAVVAELTRRIENAATHHGWRTVPPKGYVLCDDGVARKVLGTLPMTADGCVVGWGEWSLYYLRGNRLEIETHLARNGRNGWSGPQQWHDPENCYSTREAAEAARAKEGK